MTFLFMDLLGTGILIIVIGCCLFFVCVYMLKRLSKTVYGPCADKYNLYYCDF